MNWISTIADVIGIISFFVAVAAWINTGRIRAFQKSEQESWTRKFRLDC